MRRDAVLRTLREAETRLRARGGRRAALFGSVARGDDHDGSDIDILVELAPAIGIFGYAGIRQDIQALFTELIDVVDREGLKADVRPGVTTDVLYAF